MPFHLTEYRIHQHIFFTSAAPCIVAYQQIKPFKLKDCIQGFASELREKSITHVVVLLTEEEMDFFYDGILISMYEAFGFKVVHYPILNHDIPKDLHSFAELQDQLIELTKTDRILTHCLAGFGRTGLVAAGLVVALGSTALKAIQVIRQKNPRAIETKEQERFLSDYSTLVNR